MISCKEYVDTIKEELKEEISTFCNKPVLAVIQIGNDPASNSYIKGKRKDCEECGIEFNHIHIKEYNDISEDELICIIKALNEEKKVSGIIVQLPIPSKYNVEKIQKYISPQKDVDGFRKDSCFEPCTPKGIIDWLDYNNYDLEGKNVTVIGRSKIVGKPLVNMLIDKGATVTCCNSKTKDIRDFTKEADLVISAIGKAKYFDCTYFYEPDIIVDVGINRDENGKLCGDINANNVKEWYPYTYITPVPCGVGKLTICALLENVVKAYEINKRSDK